MVVKSGEDYAINKNDEAVAIITKSGHLVPVGKQYFTFEEMKEIVKLYNDKFIKDD